MPVRPFDVTDMGLQVAPGGTVTTNDVVVADTTLALVAPK